MTYYMFAVIVVLIFVVPFLFSTAKHMHLFRVCTDDGHLFFVLVSYYKRDSLQRCFDYMKQHSGDIVISRKGCCTLEHKFSSVFIDSTEGMSDYNSLLPEIAKISEDNLMMLMAEKLRGPSCLNRVP